MSRRIIPGLGYVVGITPIYKPWNGHLGQGEHAYLGDLLTMANHEWSSKHLCDEGPTTLGPGADRKNEVVFWGNLGPNFSGLWSVSFREGISEVGVIFHSGRNIPTINMLKMGPFQKESGRLPVPIIFQAQGVSFQGK